MAEAPRIPRDRWVDEGEWGVAAPAVTLAVALAGTAVSILIVWGAWEVARWVWRVLVS